MVTVKIDGQELQFPAGTLLFDACREARGEALPHFCYHPDLPVAGVCRLCQVEVEGMPKLTIACNTTVRDGMVVHTRSERVRKASQQILEMHLINHPVDCPICDQAGECGLQDQYMNYGLYESEVEKRDKVHKAKAQVIGPHVILDKERCVLCSRCVRFCDTVTGTSELGIFQRGDRAEIGIAPGKELSNAYSLNTVDICPVGALTSRDFRFKKRVWLLKSTRTVCHGCATGCSVRVDHEGDRIYRLKPELNREVNGPWMCDQGRLTYRSVHSEKRLAAPLLRRDGGQVEVPWAEALAAVKEAGAPGAWIASPQQTLEELALFAALAGDAPRSGGVSTAGRGEGDAILIDADKTPNRAALDWTGLPQHDAGALIGLIKGTKGAVLVYGGDPAAEAEGFLAAVGGRPLIYLGTHRNATSEAAAVVLPVSAWAERDGLLVNRQGRVQASRRAVARPEQAREDWRLLADWLRESGAEDAPAGLPALRRWVAERVPAVSGLDLNALPAAGAVPAGAASGAGGER
ncbi:MAG TPA: 2Fe-2S iron-sulfur cluster-binding protein [Candidatus Krumholzibacteria bacterium]|nr:2Fe-2S iron-sulfur cluster-binding protein [Candidatus Krumholzibacteria bacterium]HRX50400.1 2Fe-2S iron-sulfur cluster-binding protein [Candidatus Krumholzibacteria bacterium]